MTDELVVPHVPRQLVGNEMVYRAFTTKQADDAGRATDQAFVLSSTDIADGGHLSVNDSAKLSAEQTFNKRFSEQPATVGVVSIPVSILIANNAPVFSDDDEFYGHCVAKVFSASADEFSGLSKTALERAQRRVSRNLAYAVLPVAEHVFPPLTSSECPAAAP